MEIAQRLGEVTAVEIRSGMANPPTDAAVRSILRILVRKGHLKFKPDGPRYIYSPTIPARMARRSALERVAHTFFDDSVEGVMAALLETRGSLTSDEKRRLKDLIDNAREEGR